MNVLEDVNSQTALLAELGRLKAENELLKARAKVKAGNRVSYKVSEKGALSIYGLGRFPVTLYLSQFDAVAAAWEDIKAFVEANRASFAVKE